MDGLGCIGGYFSPTGDVSDRMTYCAIDRIFFQISSFSMIIFEQQQLVGGSWSSINKLICLLLSWSL